MILYLHSPHHSLYSLLFTKRHLEALPWRVLEDTVTPSPVIKFLYESHDLEPKPSAAWHTVIDLIIPKIPSRGKNDTILLFQEDWCYSV